jgi:hypothetical protein
VCAGLCFDFYAACIAKGETMSAQRPVLVYVGDFERGHALQVAAAGRDWLVYHPAETMEALGMIVSYCPDVVVIDMTARPTMAVEVYFHLQTMTGLHPRLILLDRNNARGGDGVMVLPSDISRRVVMKAVETTLRQLQPAF